MNAVILGRESNQISLAIDSEAVDALIESVHKLKQGSDEERITVQTTGSDIDIVFLAFDIQDKRIQGFFRDKEEFSSIRLDIEKRSE